MNAPKHWIQAMAHDITAKGWIEDIFEEYIHASQERGNFASPHEGYAVILGELEELWHAVKQSKHGPMDRAMAQGATQIAAASLRFLVDFCRNPPDKEDATPERG